MFDRPQPTTQEEFLSYELETQEQKLAESDETLAILLDSYRAEQARHREISSRIFLVRQLIHEQTYVDP